MFESIFGEFAALLIIAAAVGAVGVMLRQPLLVSFIAAGILMGPSGFGIIEISGSIELLAELGIAVLLFLVGLKLDPHLIRSLGKVALTTGLGQVIFTSVFGFLLCLAFGLSLVASTYVAVALTFSSTIIIVKLLSDKREIDSLHGRIALGFLIVQDLVVVIAMVVLSAFGVGTAAETTVWADIARLVLFGLLFIVAVALFSRYLAELLLGRIARSQELMVCFAIGWAAALAAAGDAIGFSKELGGLIAGVSIAYTSYKDAIASRLTSLRDFLLLFFFISLGARLDLALVGTQLLPAAGLSLFVLIGNPLIVMIIMGVMGYRKRTGFLAGLTVAQISEFSLIFMAMGYTLGHVSDEAVALVTLVGLITIGLSTYMILYSHRLYAICERFLGVFERQVPYREDETAAPEGHRYDVILFGLGRYGGSILRRLRAAGVNVLGIDFDPDVVRRWQRRGETAIYGDLSDPEFAETLPLAKARWVVAATPPVHTGITHLDPRRALLGVLANLDYQGRIAVTGHDDDDDQALRRAGADLILMPFVDAADQAVDLLLERQRRPALPPNSEENGELGGPAAAK